eukprot:scaffold3823_cov195-Amphora_coffeaeformis.AAC.25
MCSRTKCRYVVNKQSNSSSQERGVVRVLSFGVRRLFCSRRCSTIILHSSLTFLYYFTLKTIVRVVRPLGVDVGCTFQVPWGVPPKPIDVRIGKRVRDNPVDPSKVVVA